MSVPGEPFHRRAGTMARDGFELVLTPEDAGWGHASLRIAALPAGGACTVPTARDEVLVVALAGSAVVAVDGVDFPLHGRRDVFGGLSDVVYAPVGSTVVVRSEAGGRFAVAGARATRRFEPCRVAAAALPVELRGAGSCSRQVVDLCTPESVPADRLIACEVYTPAGNWSSYPPHKHDEAGPGETVLEEIYYFEVANGPSAPGAGYQRVYGGGRRDIDVLAEVRSGDVVLVPYGWHGPTMAMPGYDLYHLNVMAGPGSVRAWRVCLDADHAWVAQTWAGQAVDPRLPLAVAPAE